MAFGVGASIADVGNICSRGQWVLVVFAQSGAHAGYESAESETDGLSGARKRV